MQADFGKQYEVIRPTWKGQSAVGTVLFILGSFLALSVSSMIAKFLLGFLALGAGAYMVQGFAKSQAGIWFYERGLVVREPLGPTQQIPLEKIDNYDWEATEETNVEQGIISDDVDVSRQITLLISYEDEKGKFHEVNWTEEYPAGSIKRLQRASQRAADFFHQLELQAPGSGDDFYDE